MKFDLNMEEVLEAWKPSDAIREVIANALDEQKITKTENIQIYKENNAWIIRDFGRGFHYSMLTQCENQEKKNHPGVIGQFGCGILDAIGVLYRHNIELKIISKFGTIKIDKCLKNQTNIETLHAIIDQEPVNIIGTKVIINCNDDQILEAKNNFLHFENLECLEKTAYGEVYRKTSTTSYVYVNGIKIAEEPDFMFNYNITKLDSKIRKSLNRERKNVGRSSYTDLIQKILNELKSYETCNILVEEFKKQEKCDELAWKSIAFKAINLLNKANPNTVFLSEEEIMDLSDREREILNEQGKEIFVIKDSEHSKINYTSGFNTLFSSIQEYSDSFEYEFIDYNQLNKIEREIFDTEEVIFKLLGIKYDKNLVKIAKEINPTNISCTLGVWDSKLGNIVIARSQLQNLEDFAGTLAHELTHFTTGEDDRTREFENGLTTTIGKLLKIILSNHK